MIVTKQKNTGKNKNIEDSQRTITSRMVLAAMERYCLKYNRV